MQVASHSNRRKTYLPPMRMVHYRRSCDERKRITTMWTDSCHASARPAGSGRTRKQPRLIAGLIPHADGTVSLEMRQALNERRELIEQRADALVDQAVDETADWVQPLLPQRHGEEMTTG